MSNYNVDDILEEVKRKREREARQSRESREPRAPAPPAYERREPPRREPSPDYPGWGTPAPPQRPAYDYDYPPPAYDEPRYERPPERRYERPPEPRYERPPERGYDRDYDRPPERRPAYDDYRRPPEDYPRRERYAPERYEPPYRDERYPYEQPPRESYRPPEEYYPRREREPQPYEEPPRPARRAYADDYADHYPYERERREPYPQPDYPPAMPAAPATPPIPIPPPATPPPSVKRRTPKPSMDDLLQNFGEGVGLGKGLDPDKPIATTRRKSPIVGQPEPLTEPDYDASPAPPAGTAGFPNTGAGVFSFHFSPTPVPEAPPPYTPPQPYAPVQATGTFSYTPTPGPVFTPPPEPEPEPLPEPEPIPPEPIAPAAPMFTPEPAFQAEQVPAAQIFIPPEPEPFEPKDVFTPPEPKFEPKFEADFGDEKPDATRVSSRAESSLLHNTPLAAVGAHIRLAPEDTQDDEPDDARYQDDEEERQAVLGEIGRARIGLWVRFGLTAAAFLSLFYFGLAYLNPGVPTFPFMWAEGDTMRTFLIVNLLLVGATMLVNSPVIGGGLVSLCTLRADGDSLISLAMLGCVAQGVALIITPSAASFDSGIHLYYCVPVFGLLLNLTGRLMQLRRIELGARVACAEGDKYVMRTIRSEDLSRELSRGLPIDLPEITYSVKAKYVCSYLGASYAHDYAESLNRILVLITLAACVAVSFLTYYLFPDTTVYSALSVCSALLAVCAPATTTIVSNLPMLRAALGLQKSGAAIAGYPVVEEYNDVKAATFKAKELFPEDSITLCAMKVFQENQVEGAILDASSVICATDSPLAPIFRNMINSNAKILKPVENIVYEDGMGLSAWVDGKRVLIGNAHLMRNHGVATPSRDYELRVAGEGKEILYLANSGELTALFALSYSSDRRVAMQMQELAGAGVSLIVHTTDPNVTPARIAELFHYPEHAVRIVPATLHADYDRVTAPRTRAKATILYNGTIMSMFRALGMIPRIKASVTAGTACQLMAMVIGYAVVTFFAFFAGMNYVSFYLLLAYQAVWAVATALVACLRKI